MLLLYCPGKLVLIYLKELHPQVSDWITKLLEKVNCFSLEIQRAQLLHIINLTFAMSHVQSMHHCCSQVKRRIQQWLDIFVLRSVPDVPHQDEISAPTAGLVRHRHC